MVAIFSNKSYTLNFYTLNLNKSINHVMQIDVGHTSIGDIYVLYNVRWKRNYYYNNNIISLTISSTPFPFCWGSRDPHRFFKFLPPSPIPTQEKREYRPAKEQHLDIVVDFSMAHYTERENISRHKRCTPRFSIAQYM